MCVNNCYFQGHFIVKGPKWGIKKIVQIWIDDQSSGKSYSWTIEYEIYEVNLCTLAWNTPKENYFLYSIFKHAYVVHQLTKNTVNNLLAWN